jgi:hypothetical protein
MKDCDQKPGQDALTLALPANFGLRLYLRLTDTAVASYR